jgi:competence protein ComEA
VFSLPVSKKVGEDMDFLEYADSFKSKLHAGSVKPAVIVGCIAVVIAIVGVVVFGVFSLNSGSAEFEVLNASSSNSTQDAQDDDTAPSQLTSIYVDVEGAVQTPGVVCLEEGSRVADAIDAAGGLTDQAYITGTNQARSLTDGEQIVIPTIEEHEASLQASVSSSGDVSSASAQSQDGKININTATSAELQTISGIGESKAQKIIDYRNANGNFKSIDELTNVSGIGDKTLESIRDKICV